MTTLKEKKGLLTYAFRRAAGSPLGQEALMQYMLQGTGAAAVVLARGAFEASNNKRAAKKEAMLKA